MLTMLFRFLKVMFSGFAALLWATAILCFVATAIQAANSGEEMVCCIMSFESLYKLVNLCRLTTTSTLGLPLSWWWW